MIQNLVEQVLGFIYRTVCTCHVCSPNTKINPRGSVWTKCWDVGFWFAPEHLEASSWVRVGSSLPSRTLIRLVQLRCRSQTLALWRSIKPSRDLCLSFGCTRGGLTSVLALSARATQALHHVPKFLPSLLAGYFVDVNRVPLANISYWCLCLG